MGTFRITELAKRFGLARSTLLHYDHLGLLKPSGRTAADYRLYTEADLVRLERICAFREAGLGLADIAQVLDDAEEENGILERRLREIGREVAALRSQQRVLVGMLQTAAKDASAVGLDKDLWLELQKACGLDRTALEAWHRGFERRSPRAHHDFLLALGLSEKEAIQVRMLTRNVETNEHEMKYFYELFEELPRQGPGCAQATLGALAMAKGIPRKPRVLDIGCGRGRQTLILAKQLATNILAIDNHRPVLAHLDRDAARENLPIETRELSMIDMPFDPESFDLIWAEGSIFIIGLERGLKEFRAFLPPDGILAFTEMCLFEPDPPDELRDWLDQVYPDIRTQAQVRALAIDTGYEVTGSFELPDSAWWTDYYDPMLARIEHLKVIHAKVPEAQDIYSRCQLEAQMHRKHSKHYGYAFFVLRKAPSP